MIMKGTEYFNNNCQSGLLKWNEKHLWLEHFDPSHIRTGEGARAAVFFHWSILKVVTLNQT
jgi:hypothetical protein